MAGQETRNEFRRVCRSFSVISVLLLCSLCPTPGFSQSQILRSPSGEEVLQRCEKGLSEVDDYTVDLEVTVKMERLRVPDMKATMLFKKPDKIRFKSDGFMMLPREGFGVPVETLREHYDAAVMGVEDAGGRSCFRLHLNARNPAREIQSITVWVDRERFVIVKTSTLPSRGRSVTIQFEHGLQEDEYWLPVRLIAEFASTQSETADSTESPIPVKPQLQELRRAPRNGRIEIRFSNYSVNTGLSDEDFREEIR